MLLIHYHFLFFIYSSKVFSRVAVSDPQTRMIDSH